jgi:DNA (cytosine-5)-methyltransferase 1
MTQKKRSKAHIQKNMESVRSEGSKMETAFEEGLRSAGIIFDQHCRDIIGTPDFVIRPLKIAIFCDSSFFHGYKWEEKGKAEIKSNKDFWIKKIEDTIKRDKNVNEKLANQGWLVLRFWDFRIKDDLASCIDIVKDKIEKRTEFVAVDFFCGAGGMTRGLLDAGVKVIFGIDIDADLRKTYETNNKWVDGTYPIFLQKDLSEWDPKELREILGRTFDGKKLIFAACPPCQFFTKINTAREKSKKEKNLLLSFISFVEEFKPDYILIENVAGIQWQKNGNILSDFAESIKRNYFFCTTLIDAKKYGVPQTRRRVFLLASKHDSISFPEETCKTPEEYVTSSVAFRFPPLKAGEENFGIPNHRAAKLSELNLKRIKAIKNPGGSRTEWPEELQLECYKEHRGNTDVYGRMNPNKPAPTITTRFNSLSNGRFGHPTEDRAISLREGAALQTFPDDYIFYSSSFQKSAKYIGNAVPVRLAYVMGRHIVKTTHKQIDEGV